MIKIKVLQILQQDIENDPTIRDQKATLGCHLLCSFGKSLVSVIFASHTVNNLDSCYEQSFDNEGNKIY